MEVFSKADLSELIAEQHDLSKATARRLVDSVFVFISEILAQGDEVKINEFGTFSIAYIPPIRRRNMKTGVYFDAPATKRVKFKPGTKLTRTVKEGE